MYIVAFNSINIYILKSNTILMDNRGYVMSGMSFLLVLPAILLFAVFLDMANEGIGENSRVIGSGSVLNTARDLEADIMVAGKEVLKNEADNVMNSGTPLSDSRAAIKTDLQTKMDQKIQDYEDNSKMDVDCNISSVGNSEDPFAVQINSTIYVGKGNITHWEYISQDIPITDSRYPISNPLPFIKCKDHGGVQVANNKIAFGSSLANYLDSRGVENAFAYVNSTTALTIKKCPYDPYKMHGANNNTLKNCIDNGYFHESADGPCFLCRLEGKGTCPHYGMETFIVPCSSSNNSVNSSNSSENFTYNAPSSIDHVIFDDIYNGTYQGEKMIYYSDGFKLLIIYLENAHRQKYGFPIII